MLCTCFSLLFCASCACERKSKCVSSQLAREMACGQCAHALVCSRVSTAEAPTTPKRDWTSDWVSAMLSRTEL